MPVLTAGFGLSRITPSSDVRLAGYGARTAKSAGVHDELYVRALTLSDGECTLAIVSVDVLALDSDFIEQARHEIYAATGLRPNAVMIAATHTHGGPVTTSMFLSDEPLIDPGYMERLRAGIVNAVTEAWNGRFPARIGIGVAHAEGIGGNRHQLDGATDRDLGILKIADRGGRTVGVCLNYSCHPTVLGPDNLRVTADFPGFLVDRVTQPLGSGGFAMFLNGAAGNISVGRSPEATALGLAGPGRTFVRAAKIGHKLADSAIAMLPSIETSDKCVLDFARGVVDLDLRPLPPPQETAAARLRAQKLLDERRRTGATPQEIQKAQLAALYATLKHYEASRRAPGQKHARLEIQCFRIGDAAFLGLPVEPFVEIGLELKRAAASRLFIVELANGYMGYLPASDVSKEHGYETESARFTTGSDRILIPKALELERELFERARGGRTQS